MNYKISYYLNTACRERRSERRDDIENDFICKELEFKKDIEALQYLLFICQGFDQTFEEWEEDSRKDDPYFDTYTKDDFEYALDGIDWGAGDPIPMKIEKNGKVIYDSGFSLEDETEVYLDDEDYDDEDYDD